MNQMKVEIKHFEVTKMYYPNIVIGALQEKCEPGKKGINRIGISNMDFTHYEICREDGHWETKVCPAGSIFWNLMSCCISLGNFPVHQYCL